MKSGKSIIHSETIESPIGKVLLVIGDAAEVIDTVYPLMRMQEAGYRVVVAGPHVFSNLRHRAGFVGGPGQGIHAFRAIELDPENARILRFVQEVIYQLWSHLLLSFDVNLISGCGGARTRQGG